MYQSAKYLSLIASCFLILGVATTIPNRVTHLRSTAKTDTTITLKWKNQNQADRYQIRVIKPNGKLLKKVWTRQRSKTITALKSGKQYQFKVRAQIGKKSNHNFGRYSKTIHVRTTVTEVSEESGEDTTDETNNDNSIVDDTNTNETDTSTENDGGTSNDTTEDDASEEEVGETVASPILFGFWGLNGYHTADGLVDVQDRFQATVFQVASGSGTNYAVNTFLPMIRTAGMKVTLRLSGSQSEYTTAGSFDLAKWKALVARWEGSGIQEFIDDGTLVGHMLLDDIDTYSVTDATAADLEEMARYSEELLPGLMTYVRQKCNRMPTPTVNAGRYIYVDNCVNQYTNYQGYSDGPIADYIVTQTAAAEAFGLGMINGLNIADGGDGSSGQPGASSGKYAMSATEITEYGEALLAVPDIQMFLMWEYDGQQVWSDGSIGSDYFDQPELQAALATLGVLAAE